MSGNNGSETSFGAFSGFLRATFFSFQRTVQLFPLSRGVALEVKSPVCRWPLRTIPRIPMGRRFGHVSFLSKTCRSIRDFHHQAYMDSGISENLQRIGSVASELLATLAADNPANYCCLKASCQAPIPQCSEVCLPSQLVGPPYLQHGALRTSGQRYGWNSAGQSQRQTGNEDSMRNVRYIDTGKVEL